MTLQRKTRVSSARYAQKLSFFVNKSALELHLGALTCSQGRSDPSVVTHPIPQGGTTHRVILKASTSFWTSGLRQHASTLHRQPGILHATRQPLKTLLPEIAIIPIAKLHLRFFPCTNVACDPNLLLRPMQFSSSFTHPRAKCSGIASCDSVRKCPRKRRRWLSKSFWDWKTRISQVLTDEIQ